MSLLIVAKDEDVTTETRKRGSEGKKCSRWKSCKRGEFGVG